MKLPLAFEMRMKEQLGSDYNAFIDSYDRETVRGIRINTLKISVESFLEISPFELTAVPWTRNGFYVTSSEKLGKHPHYLAGLYYIQEPSAMLPAELADAKPGDVVLDLCAAPGGKSMQIAAMLENEGLIISNDISSNRLRALIRNAELMGVKNILVLNENQDKIARAFKGSIDKLLIDAPCSGEGMFKKHDEATSAYEAYDIDTCVQMQKEIIDVIPKTLKDNGELIYSTCTFNRDENENQIEYMMAENNCGLENHRFEMFAQGLEMPEAIRVYPHLISGEGHFAAKLKYHTENKSRVSFRKKNQAPELLNEFMKLNMTAPLKGHFKVIKERVFLLPEIEMPTQHVKVVKEGWYLGDLKKNRFEPSHAFALGLKSDQMKQTINFSSSSVEIIKYLKCETIHCEGLPGYNLICVDGQPVGWGKWSKGRLKNLYPSAWRLQ